MFVISTAGSTDVAEIEALITAAYGIYVERIGRKPAPMTADYDVATASGTVTVVRDSGGPLGGQLVGVLVSELKSDHLFIENIAVSPAAQGRGVGAELLRFAEAMARKAEVTQIRLYTNAAMTENLSYYPKRGFTMVGRRVEDGFERVYFVKRLT